MVRGALTSSQRPRVETVHVRKCVWLSVTQGKHARSICAGTLRYLAANTFMLCTTLLRVSGHAPTTCAHWNMPATRPTCDTSCAYVRATVRTACSRSCWRYTAGKITYDC
jgi:hypothetical protein